MKSNTCRPLLFTLLTHCTTAVLALCLGSTPAVFAQAQTNVVEPVGWVWRTDVNPATINGVAANGFRLVDIEVDTALSPMTYSGVFVRNTGAYAKVWWWYDSILASEVTQRLGLNGARLIDIEPHFVNGTLRYAAVMIDNVGADFAAAHGWETEFTPSQLTSWVSANPTRRIIDIEPYTNGSGAQRYAFVWVSNSGQTQSPWTLVTDATGSTIDTVLNQGWRMIDLDTHGGTGRMSAVMVPVDGNTWHWYPSLSVTNLVELSLQFGGRPIDIDRHTNASGATVYSVVLRRNVNDLTSETIDAMRTPLPLEASSGFLLSELGSSSPALAQNMVARVFEPAGTMKAVHHFVACSRVATGIESFSSPVIENQGVSGTCPTGGQPTTRPLRDVLRSMMEAESYTAASAIEDRFGTQSIEADAGSFGATGVALEHTLGCPCGQTRNEIRLVDLFTLHDAAASGALGGTTDDFYDLMSNDSNIGFGSWNTTAALGAALANSSLSSAERDAFQSLLRFAHKSGTYGCMNGGTRVEHASRGAYVALPFRSGCEVTMREYFIGAWVNDSPSAVSAANATGVGMESLFVDRVLAAIESWENASCTPFTTICAAVPNSTGAPGICAALGSPYISVNNVEIAGAGVPPGVFGMLVVSRAQAFIPGAGGSLGNLCLGSPIGRFLGSIQNSGTNARFQFGVDLQAIPIPGQPTGATSGEAFFFQWWHRDVTSGGAAASNYTRALQARFI